MLSSNGVTTEKNERRASVGRWVLRLLIAVVLSVLIILIFFSSGAVSH